MCGATRASKSSHKLKPSFDFTGAGTLTAGNSSPLTDGAAAVLLGSEEWVRAHGLQAQAYLRYGKVAAVDFVNKEGLLMAPAYAVPRMLKDAGLGLQDFDFYEIHEAFAAQVLCTLKAWESAEFCRDKLGLSEPLGSYRSLTPQRGGRQCGDRSSIRGDRRAHRRDARETPRAEGQRPRADFRMYRRRHGSHGHSRALMARSGPLRQLQDLPLVAIETKLAGDPHCSGPSP